MLTEQLLNFAEKTLRSVVCEGIVYFKALHVTAVLEHKQSSHPIKGRVSPKYVKTLCPLNEEACGSREMKRMIQPLCKMSLEGLPRISEKQECMSYLLVVRCHKQCNFKNWCWMQCCQKCAKLASITHESDSHFEVVDIRTKYWPELQG